MRTIKFVAMLVLGATTTGASGHDQAAVAQYLGNEGILVAHGEHKALFDAFYSNSYRGEYLLVSEQMSADVMAGRSPYDGVDAVFVSHMHGDHFAAAPALAYLRAHPDVCLYGPRQVADALTAAVGSSENSVLERVIAFDIAPGDEPASATLGDIEIDAVAIPHAGGKRMADIRNIVFRVTFGDWPTVVHMGDVGPDTMEFVRQRAHWQDRHTHAAFPPFWLLDSDEGDRILNEHIRADRVIGLHVPAKARGHGDDWRERLGWDLFTDPGETRQIGGKGPTSVSSSIESVFVTNDEPQSRSQL